MKNLSIKSANIIAEVFDARDRREDFAVVVKGTLAERLYIIAPYYERYRDAYRKRISGRVWLLLSFAWMGLRSPIFWGVCIIADFEAKKSRFVYENKALRAEFFF